MCEDKLKLRVLMAFTTFISFVLILSIYDIKSHKGEFPIFLTDVGIDLYLNSTVFVNQIFLIVFFAGLLLVYLRAVIYKNVFCCILALVGAAINTLGICYLDNQGIVLLISSTTNIVVFLNIFLGLISFFYITFSNLFLLFEKFMADKPQNSEISQIKIVGLLMLCWFPYILVYLPGRVGGDAGWAVIRYLEGNISDRHPVIYTYISGFIVELGTNLFNANFGILLNIILQYILTSIAIAYCMREIFMCVNNAILRKAIFIFYLFYPMIPMYVVTMQTDTIYGALLLIGITYFSKVLCRTKNRLDMKDCIKMSILFMITALFRKEGIIILLLTLFFALLLRKDILGFLIKTMIIFMCTFCVVSTISEQGIPNKGESRMYKYSFLFQHTARYMMCYEDEITSEEIDIIDRVLDYEQIKENYNPVLSDYVMVLYKGDAEDEAIAEYVCLMIKWFFKHPHAAVDAFINNCYAYFYPVVNYEGTIVSGITKDVVPECERFGWKHINSFEKMNIFLTNIVNRLQYLPLFGLMFMPAFYVWSVIIFVSFSAYKKDKNKCILLFPYLLSVCVCMISPANGHFRYIYSILIAFPFLLSITIKKEMDRANFITKEK